MADSSETVKRNRLLLLTHQYPYDYGDAAFIRNEIDALAEAFDEVLIVSLTAPDAPLLPLRPNVRFLGSVGTISASRAIRGMLNPARAIRAIRVFFGEGFGRSASKLRSDLIAATTGAWIASRTPIREATNGREPLAIYSFWGVDIAYVLPWLRRRANRIAVRVHRYDLDERTAGYRPLRRNVLGTADTILTIAQSGRDYLLEQAPYLAPERIVVRHLGTPPQPMPRHADHQDEVVRIASCSSVIPLKRVDLILRTASELAERGHTVAWTHFGDGPLLEEIRAEAERAVQTTPGLTIELPGRLPTDEILARYREVPPGVFLNLSTTEGIPVSAMEAASYGIPIVATNVGSTHELVGEDLGSGILVDVRDDERRIASAVERVVDPSARYDSRAVWAQRFDSAANARAAARSVLGLTR
ncbi:glycosyltransferase [Microbacterium panaciterrae]|uniref:Glycosyltransferase n=1 Tax=Microbacterium panaciterrae TaxID=985759 RepID=A0ABP8PGJ9_9MICO